ncbi:MAG: AraC family transcriptional regulator [Mucispirillum sp.]|nr:AraC family transcriptional regulator [Mucispirillum sp.]
MFSEDIFNEVKNKVLNKIALSGQYDTEIFGMQFFRESKPDKINRCFHSPFIILMLNGEKHSIFGSEEFIYGAGKYVVASVDYPVSSYVTNISEESPYLSILLPVNNNIILDIISKNEEVTDKCFCGISVADVDDNILKAFLRLIDLLDTPDDIDIIAPMIVKEIHYRILKGPIGNSLKAISIYGSKSGKIMQTIQYLKANYTESIKIDQLASMVNMAPSTFNRYFRTVTTLSPLQYQKQLRLYEAQRLMLMEDFNATTACFEVGYNSLHQFNREYKKLFGEPPYKNIKKIIFDA